MFAHVDADSFFASVLIRKHPHLRGKPLLALGMGGSCVIAATYEAKALGVKTGMRLTDALKLVPNAERMPSDFRETGLASNQIESILTGFTPLIEKTSIDEWYLDLTGCVGGVPADADTWTKTVRDLVLRKTGISVSIGVAPSKLLAKMAGEYRKPGGRTVLESSMPGVGARHALPLHQFQKSPALSIETFLRDRPAAAIPGIGRKRVVQTDLHNWKTAWDIASAPTEDLKRLFGKQGPVLTSELIVEAIYGVTTESDPPKSVSRDRCFRRERDRNLLWAHLLRHVEYTVLKMRRYDLACRGISVWLRDGTYAWEGGGLSLPKPAATEEFLNPFVRKAFSEIYVPGKAYTQVGLALWHLTPIGAEQASLFEDMTTLDERLALQQTLDELHERFGRNAITRGSALAVKSGTKIGFDLAEFESA